MSALLFVLSILCLFGVLGVFFAVSMNFIFMRSRQPLASVGVAAVGGFGLSWLALRVGMSPTAVSTAFAAFAAVKLWQARTPLGLDRADVRQLKAEMWVQAGVPNGAAYTWAGLAVLVAGGLAATVETCTADGVCTPFLW